MNSKSLPTVGLEPTIPGLGDRCLIHWATKARIIAHLSRFSNFAEKISCLCFALIALSL